MPDPSLDPAIWQKLGWAPDVDPTMGADPSPNQYGGLSLPVARRLGWAPPPSPPAPDAAPLEAPALPPPPGPTAGARPVSTGGAPRPDSQAPVSAPGSAPPSPGSKPQQANLHGAPPAPAPGPAPKPQTFDQQLAGLQQREANTEQAQLGAIGAGVEAQKQLHADQLSAYGTAQRTVEANAEQRKAEDDRWKKAYATNQAQVQSDRAQIESYKYNPNKYMDELGVGDRIRLGIAQVLAGIGQGMMKQGGPNPVTQMMQQRIHEANVAQQQQRESLVQKLGFDRETGRDAATFHATRQAELDKADGLAYTALGKQLEQAALKSADPIAQANGMKEAANVRAMGDERLKSYIQLKSDHDYKQQELGIQRQQVGIAGGQLALAGRQFDWAKNKDQQELDLKAAKLLAQKQGKLDAEQEKRAIYVPGPDGKMTVARRADGEPVMAGTAELADKYQGQINATGLYSSLADRMIRGIKDNGGESGWLKSPEWQKMQSDYQSAIATLHNGYGIESYRGEFIVDMMKKLATADIDPTSFLHDVTPALQESKANLQERTNALVHGKGFEGQLNWADTSSPPVPTQTDEQKLASDAMLNPLRGFDKRPGKLATELGNFSARGQLGPNETIDTRLKQEGGIIPSVRQAMQTWGAALNSPDLAIRRHYYQQLEKIAQESESPETAAFAQQLLDNAQAQQIGATPGTPEVTRGSAGAPR